MGNLIKGAMTIAVLLFAVVVAYGLVATAPQPEKVELQDVATSIRTLTIAKQQIRLNIRSQGSVTPRTETTLVAEVAGRVEWISANLVSGGYFNQGELLLRLDGQDLQANVERSIASLARALAEAEHSAFEFNRLAELVKNKLTSQSSVEAALRVKRVSDAVVRESKVALKQAERDYQRTEIRAPYDGLVRSKHVDVGQYIARSKTIAQIYSSDSIEVRIPLADSQLSFLNLPLGQRGELPAELQADVTLSTHYGGQYYEWQGKLVRTEAEIDTRTRMLNAVVRVEDNLNDEQPPLPVGLFVHASIAGKLVDDIAVLPRAVIRNQTQVLVVDHENRLRYRDIEILRFDRDEVYINAGLKNGELVNLSPIQTVIDGMHIKPVHQANR
ncbi:MAG: efflux RND transporter periplasmic adaptor subunit [Pseudomonadales bacterium]|nr:efflux RND transporter periplasmic adaptor subunit [Pseudomonadales bacterium]